MAYYLKGNYEKAKEYFKKTLEIKPDFKPARDIIYKNEKNIHN
jgi:tetratricopeptide (TPR) repeat protein